MVIDRNNNGSSGGINLSPVKNLVAENYPYVVYKVKKDAARDINVVMYGNSIRAHPPAPTIGGPEYADRGHGCVL